MKAFTISAASRVYAYSKPLNMCCSFPKLTELVKLSLKREPDSGDLFLFCNKRRNYVKVLYWNNHGFCIWAKMLPHAKFDMSGAPKKLTVSELERLVNDIVIHGAKRIRRLKIAA